MAAWRNFAAKQAAKRTKRDKASKETTIEEIIVQRMSSDVSGKQQKYTRIGAREYVPFDFDELSIANIINACQKYFEGSIEKGMVCDVLAGERGPSCKKMFQLNDTKTFYVRFVRPEEGDASDGDATIEEKKCKRKRKDPNDRPASTESPIKEKVALRQYPKSLSVVEMLRLGKVIAKKSSTMITIYHFDFQLMEWSSVPCDVEFVMEVEPFASGGFREAFKATSLTQGYTGTTWVIKQYLQKALDDIEETGQTPEEHTKKAVQDHFLAMNFAQQLQERVLKEDLEEEYGPMFVYNKVFLGKTDSDEFVTVEEYIEGELTKYLNNNGKFCGQDTDFRKKAESLAHFSYEKSKGRLMLLDIQGSGYKLYDPEFATKEHLDDETYLW